MHYDLTSESRTFDPSSIKKDAPAPIQFEDQYNLEHLKFLPHNFQLFPLINMINDDYNPFHSKMQ